MSGTEAERKKEGGERKSKLSVCVFCPETVRNKEKEKREKER